MCIRNHAAKHNDPHHPENFILANPCTGFVYRFATLSIHSFMEYMHIYICCICWLLLLF